jgi:hypothetical protein
MQSPYVDYSTWSNQTSARPVMRPLYVYFDHAICNEMSLIFSAAFSCLFKTEVTIGVFYLYGNSVPRAGFPPLWKVMRGTCSVF